MSSPMERAAGLVVGTVESVSPSELRVILDSDAPQATALNAGVPMGFPRINGYLLVPNEGGAIVGMVAWVGIEPSGFPRHSSTKDSGIVDLPFPSRKVTLTLLGTLRPRTPMCDGRGDYALERGVFSFPSVGDPVHLPTPDQLRGIVEPCEPSSQRVVIGTSPLAGSATVSVDPDRLFGRHLAVLGNTGSGKSCSVAGLVRWCVEAARSSQAGDGGGTRHANARFIILDPNGEYAKAFDDLGGVRLFQVEPDSSGCCFSLPAWMWNSQEWSAFSQAAPGVQRPLLLSALEAVRAGHLIDQPEVRQTGIMTRCYRTHIAHLVGQGFDAYGRFPASKDCILQIRNLEVDAHRHMEQATGPLREALADLATAASQIGDAHESSYIDKAGQPQRSYQPCSESDLQCLLTALDTVISHLPTDSAPAPANPDAPIPFDLPLLPDYLEHIAAGDPSAQATQFISTLTLRIRLMLADPRLRRIVEPEDASVDLAGWLRDCIGDDQANNGEVTIIDLSLVPSDVLHMVVSVLGRMVFEALQRYRRGGKHEELPTVLVLEEAHSFVRRGTDEDNGKPTASQMCRATFERIAREGRKFGLGLVLSSQRPSELSPTALAQCNTFILHRVVNDRDQELLGRLVPDNIGGLLKELPSLPTRHAILLGWATSVPTLVEMLLLPEEHRPRSDDPHFWQVWTRAEGYERHIDWGAIAQEWTGLTGEQTSGNGTG